MEKLTCAQRRILRKSARWQRNIDGIAIYPFWGAESEIHCKLCKRGYYSVQTFEFAPDAFMSGWFLSEKGRKALGWQMPEVTA